MFKAFNNWKVVLLSIIGATTFWFFNALNEDYDAKISYPVEFEFERDSVVVMEPMTNTLEIDVSSGGWNLLRKTFWFNVKPIQIVLENPTEIGFYTRSSLLPLVTDQLSELKVNYLITDTVFINIERKRIKKLALAIDSSKIDLAENHRIVSFITLSPDSVTLIIPQSYYDTLGDSYALSISSKGISSNFNRSVDLNKNKNRLVTIKPNQVNVQFDVDKFTRQSITIPIEKINFPEGQTVDIIQDEVQVFYTIAQSKQGQFDEDDFAITCDLNMMTEQDSTVMAILVYHPEEVMEIEVIPENIKITNGSE